MQTHLFARRTTASVAAIAFSSAALVLSAGSGSADDSQGGRPLTASLSGANEVSRAGKLGDGDPDGTGTARVTVNPGKNLVCWDIKDLNNIAAPTAGHIHEAAAGVNEGVVIPLFEGGNTMLKGCITTKLTTAREILEDPASYYVNIHNAGFPGGAIRGQLSK